MMLGGRIKCDACGQIVAAGVFQSRHTGGNITCIPPDWLEVFAKSPAGFRTKHACCEACRDKLRHPVGPQFILPARKES